MAYWNRKPRSMSPPREVVTIGDGVVRYNDNYNLSKTQAYDSRNTTSKLFPSLSTRDGFTLSFGTNASPIAIPNGAGVRTASQLHIVDGTSWKYWNGSSFATISAVANAEATIIDMNRETDTLTLLFNGTDKKAYNGTTVSDITEAPATRLVAIDDNRLYCLINNQLWYSAVLDPFDFTSLEQGGVMTLAGMKGVGTAIAAYQDIIIAFGEETMHMLYGSDYEDFQLMDPIQAGCVSHKSIIEHDSRLYFMDYNEFKVFTGGFPIEVSQKVRGYLRDINYTHKSKIVTGSQDRYIYISIPYGSAATTNNLTLEFDTENGSWYPIPKGYLEFINIGTSLFGLSPDGRIDKLNDGTLDRGQPIVWYHETGILSSFIPSAVSTLSEIWLEVDLSAGSTLLISYSENDNQTFSPIQNIHPENMAQKVRVLIPTHLIQDASRYRLKFSGTGPCKIYYLELQERVRSK